MELPEHTNISKYVIKLEEEKQLLYGLIYSLDAVELEILKTYIETHLKIRFTQSFKSPINASIFFDKKLYGGLQLCVD